MEKTMRIISSVLITTYSWVMKKILLTVLLIIGSSTVFCSCEKGEGDKVNTNNIEGKWWVPQQKADYVFSGKPVGSFTASNDFEYAEVFWYKAYLENGGCTLTDIQDGYTYTFAYTLIDNDLYVGQGIFQSYKLKIVNATKNEGAADIQYVPKVEIDDTNLDDIERNGTTEYEGCTLKKLVLDRYNGIDIYGLTVVAINGVPASISIPIAPFWYINSKGEKVYCTYSVWRGDSYDSWYDSYRIYFKAE